MSTLANPTSSSTTSITTTPQETVSIHIPPSVRLILRAEPAEERHIQWAEDVIDNEGMGKKSSKVCCIYHRPHAVDESSDSSDSPSSSSSDDDSDSGRDNDERARPIGGRNGGTRRSMARRKQRHHDHDHDNNNDKDGNVHGDGDSKSKSRRRPSPNAYEKMPKNTPPKKKQGEESQA